MNRSALLLAFAVAGAQAASAQVRVNWNEPSMGTPSVREFVAAAANAAGCVDGPEIAAREMKVTLAYKGADKPVVIDFWYAACEREYPREQEPPSEPYTVRSFLSAKGDVLRVYSNSDRPTSTVAIRRADESSSTTMMPILSDADLASGRTLDLGQILFVGLPKGDKPGTVTSAVGSIASVPAR